MREENGCDSSYGIAAVLFSFAAGCARARYLLFLLRRRLAGRLGLALGLRPRAVLARLAGGLVLDGGAGGWLLGRRRLLVLRGCAIGKEGERRGGGGYSERLDQCGVHDRGLHRLNRCGYSGLAYECTMNACSTAPCPSQRLLQAVVAPEQLVADQEGGRAVDAARLG